MTIMSDVTPRRCRSPLSQGQAGSVRVGHDPTMVPTTPTFFQIIENPNYLRTQKARSVNYLKFILHMVAKVGWSVATVAKVGWSVATVAKLGFDGCDNGIGLLERPMAFLPTCFFFFFFFYN